MTPKEQADKWFNRFGSNALNEIDSMLERMSSIFGFIGYNTFEYWNEVKLKIKNYDKNIY